MWMLSRKGGTVTAEWMQRWWLMDVEANPPYRYQIPEEFQYLRSYATDMAYIAPPKKQESMTTFKKRVYGTICIMDTIHKGEQNMRVISKSFVYGSRSGRICKDGKFCDYRKKSAIQFTMSLQ
jgi:hypothetical protein